MADPIDPPPPSPDRGPWPDVVDANQIFDHGAPWCINADGHPEYDYPDPLVHVPPFECRTIGLSVDARRDLSGPPRILEVYVAQPFRFGIARAPANDVSRPGVLFELTGPDGDVIERFSASLGDGLRLARHVLRLIDLVDQPPRRWP